MRAVWKGSISFGLVNVPVGLYPATRREELKFHLLRKRDLSPINYRRVAAKDGEEVPWDDIVKGYQYEKGRYVTLSEKDFNRVDIEATDTIDIMDFVKVADINPMYFYKPYYLEPQKGADKVYALLRDTLADTGTLGVSKVVIRTRQHLAAVKAQREVLVLELMHFREELQDACDLDIPGKVRLGRREQELARSLVERMTVSWDADRYTDDYRSALMKVIEEKVEAGGKPLPPKERPHKEATNVVDLLEVLRKSLDSEKPEAPRRVAASAKGRKRGGRKAGSTRRRSKRAA